MHHHPDMLRHALRAREHELHAHAARMTAGAPTRAGRAVVADADPLRGRARHTVGALVAELVPRRPRPAHSAE